MPPQLHDEFAVYRVAKLFGLPPAEADALDAAELNRMLLFLGAESMARAKAEHEATSKAPTNHSLRPVTLHHGK